MVKIASKESKNPSAQETLNISRIIFLVDSPFNQRDYRRFGIDFLNARGFRVEIWDLLPIFSPKVHRRIKVPDPVQYSLHFTYTDRREALNAIRQLGPSSYVICQIPYTFQTLFIYRALSKSQAHYCLISCNAMPHINRKGNWKSFVAYVAKHSFSRFFYRLLLIFPMKYLGVRSASAVLLGGEQSISKSPPVGSTTNPVWIHAFDYDAYLLESKRDAAQVTPMAVFLDEYLPFHPDYIQWGVPHETTAEEYYPALRRFFDFVEATLSLRIVVAAHPRAQYLTPEQYFGAREVIQGRTAELVRKSDVVIAHASTAVNYSILFKKPIFLITTDAINRSAIEGPQIDSLARLLNKTPINIDKPFAFNIKKELEIDSMAYVRFHEMFIKRRDTPNKPFWQVFTEFISQTKK